MGAFVTKAKIVDSWTGSPVASSLIVDQAVNLSVTAFVGTYFNASGVNTAVGGLRQWSFSVDGLIGSPLVCVNPSISFSGGNSTNLVGWDLSVSVPAVESTNDSQADTANGWASFLPGILSWTGNLFYRADDAEPGVLPAAQAATSCTLGFDASNTLEGDIILSGLTENVRIGDIPAIQHPFQGSGALTAAGSNNIVAAGAVGTMDAGACVLKYHEVGTTDVTRAGDAFYTQLNISARVGELVTYGIQAQGTGDLAIADPAV